MAEIMTLKDLAEYLRMNERTVSKLAQEGRIPGFKVASQWRFSKEAIDAWFAAQMQTAGAVQDGAVERPRVSGLLAPEAINLGLASRTKDGVLSEMTEMLVKAKRITSGSALLSALREREKLCSTGVGRGIALLHPRHAVSDIAKEPVLGFGRSVEGVDFDAVDGEKVHMFFIDCATSDRVHLALLARLSRLLADEVLLERLRSASTADDVMEAIRDAEKRLVGN